MWAQYGAIVRQIAHRCWAYQSRALCDSRVRAVQSDGWSLKFASIDCRFVFGELCADGSLYDRRWFRVVIRLIYCYVNRFVTVGLLIESNVGLNFFFWIESGKYICLVWYETVKMYVQIYFCIDYIIFVDLRFKFKIRWVRLFNYRWILIYLENKYARVNRIQTFLFYIILSIRIKLACDSNKWSNVYYTRNRTLEL